MTGTMEFRYTAGETAAVFWHKKTALQVRDDQYPGMKLEPRGTTRRSIRHGVDYCQMWSVIDPKANPSGSFLSGMIATLVEVP